MFYLYLIVFHLLYLIISHLLYLFYLILKENYDVEFLKRVYGSHSVTLQQLQRSDIPDNGSLRITYVTKDNFKKTSKALGLMDDFKVRLSCISHNALMLLSLI